MYIVKPCLFTSLSYDQVPSNMSPCLQTYVYSQNDAFVYINM